MKHSISILALVLWLAPSDSFSIDRRNALGALGSAAAGFLASAQAANAASAKTGLASPFTGVLFTI